MQAVSRRAEACQSVYVVIEPVFRPDSEECTGGGYRAVVDQPYMPVGRRLEYLDVEHPVGQIVAGELRMGMYSGAVSMFPGHHYGLPAACGVAAQICAAIGLVGVFIELVQRIFGEPLERIFFQPFTESVVAIDSGRYLQQFAEKFAVTVGYGLIVVGSVGKKRVV